MKKSIGVLSITALFLLLGLTIPSYGRQDKPEKQEDKPSAPKQEQPAKPEKQQQEAKAPKQEPQAKPEKQQQAKAPKQEQPTKQEKQQQEAKAPKQEPQAKPEKQQQQAKGQQEPQQKQQEQAKSTKQHAPHAQPVTAKQSEQMQATSSKGPQRTQEETATQHAQPALRLSSRGSGRIPDERFRSNFGRGHEFRMGNPVIVSGYSRFQYGGYWFGYVQPWPVGWFYTDQFYIDYVDGGYYMYNPYYPGSRFAITVII
jgi:hypothetical protein